MTFTPHIHEAFAGVIWRMEIDELSETLFVEIRNNEDKQVLFAAIDLITGVTNFKDLILPERWLTGIECAYDGVLLLHNYQSENGPVHKALIGVDAKSGETLWADYNFAFEYLSINGPVVYDTRVQPRILFLADISTGATKRIEEPSLYRELQNHIVMPGIGTTDFLPVEIGPVDAVGNLVYYLDYNNYRIVSLHTLEAGLLTQSLIITDGATVSFKDLLNTGIQKIQPEAFIMHKNRLIYIKDKTDLIVIVL